MHYLSNWWVLYIAVSQQTFVRSNKFNTILNIQLSSVILILLFIHVVCSQPFLYTMIFRGSLSTSNNKRKWLQRQFVMVMYEGAWVRVQFLQIIENIWNALISSPRRVTKGYFLQSAIVFPWYKVYR